MGSHRFSGGKRGGYSKSQVCLQKILSIICSIPPHQQQNSEPKSAFHGHHLLQVLDSSSSSNFQDKAQPLGHRGFHIDMNLELTSSPETENSSVGVDSTEAKSNQEKNAKEGNSFEEKRNPVSETGDEDEKKEVKRFCDGEFEQEEGSLPLVTETRELSSGNGALERGGVGRELGSQEINGEEPMKEGRECWVVDPYGRFDEVSQVVRTKRGRRRVLPRRYKDSVLQPLVRNAGSCTKKK